MDCNWKHYFSFKGRINRQEYILSVVGILFYSFLMDMLPIEGSSIQMVLIRIAVLLPFMWFILAQGAKRCHDLGNSGWFQLIPFYFLWLLFAKGKESTNEC